MAKTAFKNSTFTFNSTEYYLTSMSDNESYGEIEVTDTGTTGNGKEFVAGRQQFDVTIEVIEDPTVADITLGTEASGEADWEGKTYTGDFIFLTRAKSGSIDDKIVNSYTGHFNGTVTKAQAS